MGNLDETSTWEPGIYQLERADGVDAGVGGDGVSNLQPKQLGNRTRFLYDRTTAIAGGVTALKAIAAPTDGLVRFFWGLGLYVFDAASVEAEDLPWVAEPDDATPGRWLHELFGIQGDSLPNLLGGKVVGDQLPNRLIDASIVTLGANYDGGTGAAYADVPGLSVALADCEVGDLLMIDAFVRSTVAANCGLKLVVDDGGEQETGQLDDNRATMNFSFMWTVVNAGSVTPKLKLRSNNANSAILLGGTGGNPRCSLRVQRFRP